MVNKVSGWFPLGTEAENWEYKTFPTLPGLTAEERWWAEKVELPLDIDHTHDDPNSPFVLDDRRARRCPACQYIRGFKDGQAHAE